MGRQLRKISHLPSEPSNPQFHPRRERWWVASGKFAEAVWLRRLPERAEDSGDDFGFTEQPELLSAQYDEPDFQKVKPPAL